MIKIEKKNGYSEVTGNPVEVTFFFLAWQSFMYENWDRVLGNKSQGYEFFTEQVGMALFMLKEHSMTPVVDNPPSQRAMDHAIKCCENLGLKIERE